MSYLYNECATPHPFTVGHPTPKTSAFSIQGTGRNLHCCRSPSPNLTDEPQKCGKNDTFQAFPSFCCLFPQLFRILLSFPPFRFFVATQEAFNVITREVFQDSNRAMLQSLRFSWNKVLPHHAILRQNYHSHQVDILGDEFSAEKKNGG